MIPIGAYTDAQMGMGWGDLVVRYQLDKATAKGIVWRQNTNSSPIGRTLSRPPSNIDTLATHLQLVWLPKHGTVNKNEWKNAKHIRSRPPGGAR